MLTDKQKTFFEKLKETYGQEMLPSFDTIAKDFGFKHKNSVWSLILSKIFSQEIQILF